MSETRRIAQLLKHSYNGQPWYGSPILKFLADVTPAQAAVSSIPGAHTIWQQVLHMTAWRQFACRVLNGESAAELSDNENWPAATLDGAKSNGAEISPSAWQKTLDDLAESQDHLLATLARLSDDQLASKAPGKSYSLYVLLHGVLQHDAYHAGQIALLRNAATSRLPG